MPEQQASRANEQASQRRVAPAPAAAPTRPAAEAPPTPEAQPSPAELQRATAEVQRRINVLAPELSFSIDQSTGRTVVKIMDRETHDVIRQIPAEEILRIDKALAEFQQGLLVNRKA